MRLRSGVRLEVLGDECVLLDQGGEVAHRVSGDAATALRLIDEGTTVDDLPEELGGAIDELVEANVLATEATWSRRKAMVTGGAAWTAATVATFALADPAAAASGCGAGIVPTLPAGQMYTTGGATTYTTGAGVTSILVRAWGAGGGGSGVGWTNPDAGGYGIESGGGGGGGGYAYGASVTVAPCTTYDVVVGAGGSGGVRGGIPGTKPGPANPGVGGNGGEGEASEFGVGLIVAEPGGGAVDGSVAAGLNGGAASAGSSGSALTSGTVGGAGGWSTKKKAWGGAGGGGSGGHTGAGGDGPNARNGTPAGGAQQVLGRLPARRVAVAKTQPTPEMQGRDPAAAEAEAAGKAGAEVMALMAPSGSRSSSGSVEAPVSRHAIHIGADHYCVRGAAPR